MTFCRCRCFGGCNFWKEISSNARYGTQLSFLTYWYHKLQLAKNWKQNYCHTFLRNMKSHIESMYCIETEGDEKWKPRNSINSDQLCLTSSRHFWKMNRKWKFPNFQIYGLYDFFFSSKAWNLPKTLKILFFVLCDITYIQTTGNGNKYLNLPNKLKYYALLLIGEYILVVAYIC